MEEKLSEAAAQLISFFDHCGCLGISELIRYLDVPHEGGMYLSEFEVSGICACEDGHLGQGNFTFHRKGEQPLWKFIVLAQHFENFHPAERRIIDAVCLEIVSAIEFSKSYSLFESITFEFQL